MKTLIIYRLQDPMDNKATVSVCLRKDGTLNYNFYGSWGPSGIPYSFNNLQLEEELTIFVDEPLNIEKLNKEISHGLNSGVYRVIKAEYRSNNSIHRDKLYQCPYEKATRCRMDIPCKGCETWAAHQYLVLKHNNVKESKNGF